MEGTYYLEDSRQFWPRVPPTREETDAAKERAFPVRNKRPYRQIDPIVAVKGYPKMAAIGDSHITHWATYRRSIHACGDDAQRLSSVTFPGVGGTKLKTCIEHLSGKNLPPRQHQLGNQWNKLGQIK